MIDEVLAAKDCKCSPSFSLQTQQRRSWPPVATMDEPSAMQFIDEGEATHSWWRAAIVLLWGSLPGLPGRASPRHGSAAATQQHTHRARTVGCPTNLRLLVCFYTLAPWRGLCLCFHRTRGRIHTIRSRRQPPSAKPWSRHTLGAAVSHPVQSQRQNGSPGRRLG